MLTVKHSKKPEFKNEVRNMIVDGTALEGNYEITIDTMTVISLDSFQEIWDAPQNKHWDDFIKDRLNVPTD